MLQVRGTKVCARPTHIAYTAVAGAWTGDHGGLWSMLSLRVLDTICDRWRRCSHVTRWVLQMRWKAMFARHLLFEWWSSHLIIIFIIHSTAVEVRWTFMFMWGSILLTVSCQLSLLKPKHLRIGIALLSLVYRQKSIRTAFCYGQK